MTDAGAIGSPGVGTTLPGAAPGDAARGSVVFRRWFRYALVFVCAVMVVWAPVVLYVNFVPPTYKSQWSILLPGSGIGASVNLDNLGQTSTSVASPYTSSSVDPKVNYKEIALSLRVLRRAAELAGVAVADYAKPKIKLVDQTSILQAVFTGATAEQAQRNAASLLSALELELDTLRRSERTAIRSANLEQLSEYEQKVAQAQMAIFEFQARSMVVSSEQFLFTLETSDELARRRSEISIHRAALQGRLSALTQALDLQPDRAADVLKLQDDQQLQQLLDSYLEQAAEFQETESVLGTRHPKVRLAQARAAAARRSMTLRAFWLLPDAEAGFIDRYVSNRSVAQENLFQKLVALQIDAQAADAEIAYVDELIDAARREVGTSALQAARLQELERNHQVANTIFLSALAKLDLGRSDIFSTYPMIQGLVEPTLPPGPEKLQRAFATIGASLGSVFISLSLVLLWKRRDLLRRLSRRR